MSFLTLITFSLICVLLIRQSIATAPSNSAIIDEIVERRKELFEKIRYKELGADMELKSIEIFVNEMIGLTKKIQLLTRNNSVNLFKPAHDYPNLFKKMKKLFLFKSIRRMPKGGLLHANDVALCSTKCLMEFTYWDNLWICRGNNDSLDLREFKFSLNQPKISKHDCNWVLLSQVRTEIGRHEVDQYLRGRLSMSEKNIFPNSDDAWAKIKDIYAFVSELLTYEQVWKSYFKNALKEISDDGVQYLEFRTNLPKLYDLDGNYFSQIRTAEVSYEALQEFMEDQPNFIGSKFIYSPFNWQNLTIVEEHFDLVNLLKEKLPNFFAGLDLLRDSKRSLIEFVPQILNLSEDINLYFRLNKDNDNLQRNDTNCMDAVLLNVNRIGHGWGLMNNPLILEKIIKNDVAIEVNPISNLIFHIVDGFPTFSSGYFFANNYPVVVSSDDPSFWGAKPLSHDFFIAFQGIASENSDLKLLKKLAMNSIIYSSMNESERKMALEKWQNQWISYLQEQLFTFSTM